MKVNSAYAKTYDTELSERAYENELKIIFRLNISYFQRIFQRLILVLMASDLFGFTMLIA
jgi:hypothetical protein